METEIGAGVGVSVGKAEVVGEGVGLGVEVEAGVGVGVEVGILVGSEVGIGVTVGAGAQTVPWESQPYSQVLCDEYSQAPVRES